MLAVTVLHQLGRVLSFAGGITWVILWALVLGFLISAIVQALVSKQEMRRLWGALTRFEVGGAALA